MSSKIKIDLIELNDEIIKFNLKNVDLSLANSIRKIFISEIPTLAIDFVNIKSNTTSFNDENLSFSLGLIPLESNGIENIEFFKKCKCENVCSKCSIKFSLNVCCDKPRLNVTSADLKTEWNFKPIKFQKTIVDKLEFDTENILIAKLKYGQELKLEAFAKKGMAIDNAKWNSAIVKLNNVENQFFFEVETICSLKPEKIVLLGLSILKSKLNNLFVLLNK